MCEKVCFLRARHEEQEPAPQEHVSCPQGSPRMVPSLCQVLLLGRVLAWGGQGQALSSGALCGPKSQEWCIPTNRAKGH